MIQGKIVVKIFFVALTLYASASLAGTVHACPCKDLLGSAGSIARPVADERVLAAEDVAEVTLEVGGITCESCAYIVHTALSGATGVRDVRLRATDDPAVLRAVVICDKDITNANALAATTSGLGYPTTVVMDEPS